MSHVVLFVHLGGRDHFLPENAPENILKKIRNDVRWQLALKFFNILRNISDSGAQERKIVQCVTDAITRLLV